MPSANVATSVIAGALFLRGSWKTKRLMRPSTPVGQEQQQVEIEAQMEAAP
jgi:hypothetical protein